MAVATCIEAPTKIFKRVVDSSTAIPKGTLMKFTGAANTAAASDGDNQPFAGITIEEKVATETDITNIACAMDGAWDIDNSGAIAIGEMVNMTAANQVAVSVNADFEKGSIVGKCEEAEVADNRSRIRLLGV